MPRLQAKVEGKGNGVKTVIPNMVEIARALGRPPTCKWPSLFIFFFCLIRYFELRVNLQFIESKGRNFRTGESRCKKDLKLQI